MIKIIDSILSDTEIDFLNNLCLNFVNSKQYDELDGFNKTYNSMFIDEYKELDRFKEEVNNISKEFGLDYKLNNPGVFINKVDSIKNQNDKYHNDGCALTIIVYLNEEFTGGEFEYILDGKTHHIIPKRNLTIVMDRSVPHRVLPVKSGIRYSLVNWFNKNNMI